MMKKRMTTTKRPSAHNEVLIWVGNGRFPDIGELLEQPVYPFKDLLDTSHMEFTTTAETIDDVQYRVHGDLTLI